jgi:hypothetical protein
MYFMFRVEEQAKQEISMEAGGKQSSEDGDDMLF